MDGNFDVNLQHIFILTEIYILLHFLLRPGSILISDSNGSFKSQSQCLMLCKCLNLYSSMHARTWKKKRLSALQFQVLIVYVKTSGSDAVEPE